MSADIDVLIAVHDLSRRIDRAARSALLDTRDGVLPTGHRVRVIIGAHNLDPDQVAAALPEHVRPHTNIIEVRDPIPSPAGPFNAALQAARARYVSIVGSDDWFAPGALAGWAAHADRYGSSAVLAPLFTQTGDLIPTPRVRPGRRRSLDFVADRLAYRTAPLGLLRTDDVRALGVEFTPELTSGVDLELGLRLWTGMRQVDLGPAPGYVIGLDARQRITERSRPAAEELAAVDALVKRPWVRELPEAARRSIATKLLRIHLVPAIARRDLDSAWTAQDAEFVQDLVGRVLTLSPGATRGLHRADVAVVEAAVADASGASTDGAGAALAAAGRQRRAAGRWDILLTDAVADNLVRESTVRAHLAAKAPRRAATVAPGDGRPTVLVLSFSRLVGDARVLKQVRRLSVDHEVISCGYGPPPPGVAGHLQIPDEVVNRLNGRLITARAYPAVERSQAAVRWVWGRIPRGSVDVVLANDLDAIPVALQLAPRYGVHADLHEFFPLLHEDDPAWLRRIAPYQDWLCRRYLPRCAAVSTVSAGLASEYERRYGIDVEVITNATPAAALNPGEVGSPLRLVHSGAGLRGRRIELMITGVRDSRADVRFDLYLTPNHPDYLDELRALAAGDDRITLYPPLPYDELIPTLNRYDVGVFVLPPTTFSYRHALPNKVYDFVQARLGLLVGPSPEMAALVREHDLGWITEDFTAEAVRAAVEALDVTVVTAAKLASDRAATDLHDGPVSQRWIESIDRIVTAGRSR